MRITRIVLAAALLLGMARPAVAQQTVFLVRHAERADSATGGSVGTGTDPDLSEAGRARAESLAALLKDAGITAVFSTKYKRTKQTAEPLAKALGVTVAEVDPRDLVGLLDRMKKSSGNVLVVGHTNTIPETIKALGIGNAPSIGDTEFDNLFIVFIVTSGEKSSMVRLRYR